MKQSIILVALVLFFLQGCVRPRFDEPTCQDTCLIFAGEVSDPNNDIPLEAEVELVFTFKRAGFFDDTELLVREETPSDGLFSFSMPADYELFEKDGYFTLKATKKGYLKMEMEERVRFKLDTIPDALGRPLHAQLYLKPSARLRVVVDVSRFAQVQSLVYSYQYSEEEFGFAIPDSILGKTQPRSFLHKVAGDQFVYIFYDYVENFQSRRVRVADSIYVPAGETGEYRIEID